MGVKEIERQQELENFQSSIRDAEQTVEKLSVELDSGLASLHQAETERDTLQKRLAEQQTGPAPRVNG